MSEESTLALLRSTLELAVPMHVLMLDRLTWDQVQAMIPECAQHIAEHGDIILYRSKKKGETAAAFNALARAVAILSFSLGGVTIFGLHFENCWDI